MSSLKRNWDGMKKKLIYNMYLDEENRDVSIVTICEGYVHGIEDRIRINRWICPLSDPWILKVNLTLQRNNDEKEWIDRIKSIGYQYVNKTFEVRELFEPKLREIINTLVSGFMRAEGIHIDGLVGMVSRNLDGSIAVFRIVLNVNFDALIAGFMKDYGIYIVGIHKLVEKYIDKEMFDYLRWDRTCSLGPELSQWHKNAKYLLEGDNEWDFDLKEKNKELFFIGSRSTK